MKKFAIAILILTAAVSFFGQTKTVTNDDLEKFRRERLESERKLKEKYAEMGITPEEVERQNQQRRAELEQYSDQLRKERIEAENIIAQENALRRQYNSFDEQADLIYFSYGSLPYIVYTPYSRRRHRSVFSQFRKLPPNMRTVREYAIMYPNTPGFNRQFFGKPRFGRGRTGNFIIGRTGGFGGGRIGIGISVGGGRGSQ